MTTIFVFCSTIFVSLIMMYRYNSRNFRPGLERKEFPFIPPNGLYEGYQPKAEDPPDNPPDNPPNVLPVGLKRYKRYRVDVYHHIKYKEQKNDQNE